MASCNTVAYSLSGCRGTNSELEKNLFVRCSLGLETQGCQGFIEVGSKATALLPLFKRVQLQPEQCHVALQRQ